MTEAASPTNEQFAETIFRDITGSSWINFQGALQQAFGVTEVVWVFAYVLAILFKEISKLIEYHHDDGSGLSIIWAEYSYLHTIHGEGKLLLGMRDSCQDRLTASLFIEFLPTAESETSSPTWRLKDRTRVDYVSHFGFVVYAEEIKKPTCITVGESLRSSAHVTAQRLVNRLRGHYQLKTGQSS